MQIKNVHAQAMAKMRARSLTAERRSEIAKIAVTAREAKKALKVKELATPKK